MRVLDIDLDAFMHATRTMGAPSGQRLDSGSYPPWSEDLVREFLETRCGLSSTNPSPGAAFEHHHEAFFYWEELIRQRRLGVPFDVVHLDAHSDLSVESTGAHIYILTELTRHRIAERATHLERDRVTFANFPAFAAALGWFESFTWVRPPEGDVGFLEYYLRDGAIRLGRYPEGTFSGPDWDRWHRLGPLSHDEPIPASMCSTDEYYTADPFDYVTICRSPQFTPVESDVLFGIVRSYIDEQGGAV
jgi:uncharacterized protein UPF0489